MVWSDLATVFALYSVVFWLVIQLIGLQCRLYGRSTLIWWYPVWAWCIIYPYHVTLYNYHWIWLCCCWCVRLTTVSGLLLIVVVALYLPVCEYIKSESVIMIYIKSLIPSVPWLWGMRTRANHRNNRERAYARVCVCVLVRVLRVNRNNMTFNVRWMSVFRLFVFDFVVLLLFFFSLQAVSSTPCPVKLAMLRALSGFRRWKCHKRLLYVATMM